MFSVNSKMNCFCAVYLSNPKANTIDNDGWPHTGDIALMRMRRCSFHWQYILRLGKVQSSGIGRNIFFRCEFRVWIQNYPCEFTMQSLQLQVVVSKIPSPCFSSMHLSSLGSRNGAGCGGFHQSESGLYRRRGNRSIWKSSQGRIVAMTGNAVEQNLQQDAQGVVSSVGTPFVPAALSGFRNWNPADKQLAVMCFTAVMVRCAPWLSKKLVKSIFRPFSHTAWSDEQIDVEDERNAESQTHLSYYMHVFFPGGILN